MNLLKRMTFETVFVIKCSAFHDLKTLLEELIVAYENVLVRFSLSFFEPVQAVLWVELRLDSSRNPNDIFTRIQNLIETHQLTVEKIYKLFNEDQSLTLTLKKNYVNNCEASFDIQSAAEIQTAFENMYRNLRLDKIRMRYINKMKRA